VTVAFRVPYKFAFTLHYITLHMAPNRDKLLYYILYNIENRQQDSITAHRARTTGQLLRRETYQHRER